MTSDGQPHAGFGSSVALYAQRADGKETDLRKVFESYVHLCLRGQLPGQMVTQIFTCQALDWERVGEEEPGKLRGI